jgi:signal transduction histidine kinase
MGETPSSCPDLGTLLSLGATRLPPVEVRLPDESISVRMSELLEGDPERLQRTYRFVLQIHDWLRPRLYQDGAAEGLIALLDRSGFHHVSDEVSALGTGMRRRDVDPRMRKAYHDLRGGSLLAMLMHLELVQLGHATAQDAVRVFILARDHLKIMRNTVSDLDPVRHTADLEAKDHDVELLREKWSSVGYPLSRRGVAVELDCPFDGVIASCCMELSTLDRVIYNLVNNAAQQAADDVVRLSVLPMDDGPEPLLRIAVLNRIALAQLRALRQRFGEDLGQVFRGGFSTDGTGLGLRIVADLVTHGFRLPSVPFAVDHGYLGAVLLDDWFVAWFHWPARRAPPPATR